MNYESIPQLSMADVEQMLVTDYPDCLTVAALSAALYGDPIWAQEVCLQLVDHIDPGVRGSALVGLGCVARIHQLLDPDQVMPVIEAALLDPNPYVRGQAEVTADDVEIFLHWRVQRPSVVD